MTRIIAGEFGGRRLSLPADQRVRPTADRVREAWMSILADRLPGARVLDLFAGSGALGLEALSRGAAQATFVELSSSAVAAIHANASALGVAGRVTVRRGDALRFIQRLDRAAFDLALADPPYSVPFAERLVAAFRERPFAGMLAVEHPASVSLAADETRRYGDVALSFCHL
jgi:16S rRNA (guanine966-N2)-methyltransferase